MTKILILLVCVHFLRAEIPSYVKVCKSSEPDLGSCIKESINALRPNLIKGIPELNVPPIEPFFIDEISLINEANAFANTTNIKVWGPSSYEIMDLKANYTQLKFSVKVRLPQVRITGDYFMNMKLLGLPFKGHGPVTANFKNYSFDCIVRANTVQKKGKDYFYIKKIHLNLHPGQSSVNIKNLFKDRTLAKAANVAFSENLDMIIRETKPIIERSLAEKFTDFGNVIADAFTFQELFP